MRNLYSQLSAWSTGSGHRYRVLAPFVVAIALLTIGYGAQLLVSLLPNQRVFFLYFVPGVLAATILGGRWPGLAATAVGFAMGSMLLMVRGAGVFAGADALLFAILGSAIAIAGDRLQRSQRQAAELARSIAQREAYLRAILDTVPDALITIDIDGTIQSFSPAAERLFGQSADEVRGRNIQQFVPILGDARAVTEVELAHPSGPVQIRKSDGTTVPVDVNVGRSFLPDRTHITLLLRDVTKRLQDEARLQELQTELLSVSRLSAVGEMSAAIAHELNQPLSAITNYMKAARRLVMMENPQSRAAEALDRAGEQALRAGLVIRQLRELVMHDTSDRPEQDVVELISGTGLLAAAWAREQGASMTLDIDTIGGRVLADKTQIQQVVLNLVRNGLDAMQGAPDSELVLRATLVEESMVKVCISDSGTGVSALAAERLFNPFFSTKGSQGMGLGLSICRTIVQAHGGEIWHEPRLPRGATFCFTLPLAHEAVG